mgnify:CR=1 FL=1
MSSGTARYLDALALPHVRGTFGAALVGRAAYALVFLPLLFAVSQATGSIALAGLAVAIYGAGASFLAPVRAWLIDTHGARTVLAILVIAFSAGLAGLGLTALIHGSGALLILLAGATGAAAPPLGPTMRVAWGMLAPTDELLRKSLSLDAVVEELLYLAGPAVAGLALTVLSPGAVLLAPAALMLAGGLLFLATPAVGAMAARASIASRRDRDRPLLLRARFVGLLLAVFVAGAIVGTVEVSVPTILAEDGGAAGAGLALGLFAGGSALGGLLYGAVTVPGSVFRQLLALVAALAATTALIALVTGVAAVSLVLAIAGLFFAPAMIVAYLAANAAGGDGQKNSATTWVNTSHNLGGTAGTAIAGVLAQAAGAPAAVIAMAVGAAAAGRLQLATPSPIRPVQGRPVACHCCTR